MTISFRNALMLLVLIISTGALACGDSLYRVGKGVTYRTYSAPIPGNLLIYGFSNGAGELAEQLARSGHSVHLAEGLDELSAALVDGGYDVVIAPYDDREMIELASTGTASVAFLPVVFSKEQRSLARQSYEQVMIPDKHGIKHYLKAIHRTLKNRG